MFSDDDDMTMEDIVIVSLVVVIFPFAAAATSSSSDDYSSVAPLLLQIYMAHVHDIDILFSSAWILCLMQFQFLWCNSHRSYYLLCGAFRIHLVVN